MKFKNDTGEKLLCHEERPGSSVGREMFWVKPGQVVEIKTDSVKYGEAQKLTHIPEEETSAETSIVGETAVETKQIDPVVSKRKRK